ncbi:MAG: WbqC family protein [Deltaproteobacteria bacterium]|nr:WbqC family protein [Deltaproteobacteria bacterium]
MIVSAYQPYFAPFAGFFSKAARSDIVVLMDSVQFPRGTTWLTRNRFKNDRGALWMTIPVWQKGLGFQKINEVRICHEGRWAKKHLESLRTAYANAPFFEEHLTFIEEIFSDIPEKLVDLNLNIIRYLMKHLELPAKVILLSELDIDAKEPRLSMEVCKKLGASHFLAQSSAKKYLDKTAFQEAGIAPQFFNPRYPVYPQLWGTFVTNLSAFDLLFNCGPKAQNILKKA